MTQSTTETYDDDLAIVEGLLAGRLQTAIKADPRIVDQLPKWLGDALNNSWVDSRG